MHPNNVIINITKTETCIRSEGSSQLVIRNLRYLRCTHDVERVGPLLNHVLSFLKYWPNPATFCLFTSFSRHNSNINWKIIRNCARESNLWPQDCRSRLIHLARYGVFFIEMFSLQIILSYLWRPVDCSIILNRSVNYRFLVTAKFWM